MQTNLLLLSQNGAIGGNPWVKLMAFYDSTEYLLNMIFVIVVELTATG